MVDKEQSMHKSPPKSGQGLPKIHLESSQSSEEVVMITIMNLTRITMMMSMKNDYDDDNDGDHEHDD